MVNIEFSTPEREWNLWYEQFQQHAVIHKLMNAQIPVAPCLPLAYLYSERKEHYGLGQDALIETLIKSSIYISSFVLTSETTEMSYNHFAEGVATQFVGRFQWFHAEEDLRHLVKF